MRQLQSLLVAKEVVLEAACAACAAGEAQAFARTRFSTRM